MIKQRISVTELLQTKIDDPPLISVVIPVYNVERYLARCLDSVLAQTYEKLEIILVDDGSKDQSGEICEKYREKDERIIVIHQENQGQSAARNSGVKCAHGDYLCFVDSDDCVTSDYAQIMLNVAKVSSADIVQTRIKIIFDELLPENLNHDFVEVLMISDAKYAPNDLRYKVAPVAKMYRTELVRKHPFPAYKSNEDDATYYRFSYDADKICILDYYTYFYFQTTESVMRSSIKKEKKSDFIPIYYERILFYEQKKEPELILGSRNRFCLILMLSYANYRKHGTNLKDQPEILRIFKEQYAYLKGYPLGFTRRCEYFLFRHFPNLAAKMIGLLRK